MVLELVPNLVTIEAVSHIAIHELCGPHLGYRWREIF